MLLYQSNLMSFLSMKTQIFNLMNFRIFEFSHLEMCIKSKNVIADH